MVRRELRFGGGSRKAGAASAGPRHETNMIPIHRLLARIRWDVNLARSDFSLGYWDRVASRVRRVGLRDVCWDAENPSFFDVTDANGIAHEIPFHRVREVWRDGKLIWKRSPPGDLG